MSTETPRIISTVQKIDDHCILKGQLIDEHTRCIHYYSSIDIIAIKFKCCETYYPCYKCHEELAGHSIEKYDIDCEEKVILCGDCYHELTFNEYKSLSCIYCNGKFNPGCSIHYHLYFNRD